MNSMITILCNWPMGIGKLGAQKSKPLMVTLIDTVWSSVKHFWTQSGGVLYTHV